MGRKADLKHSLRLRQEALRQLDTADLDDDDFSVDSLEALGLVALDELVFRAAARPGEAGGLSSTWCEEAPDPEPPAA